MIVYIASYITCYVTVTFITHGSLDVLYLNQVEEMSTVASLCEPLHGPHHLYSLQVASHMSTTWQRSPHSRSMRNGGHCALLLHRLGGGFGSLKENGP